ncbi:MAG: filamentous hemagglutinin N-terminal domain-containing protein [Oscillatoriales cyanobacterium SM2_2_1]|nr:filamentous hemagglutinin N-terminal domain-containing protein [Oscillatoriales cyanobacterium SM2_2_1]
MKRIPPHTFLLVGLAFSAAPAFAQITPDQSTATEVRGNEIAPTGTGTVNGGNLYHSFDRFNVPAEGVRFTTGTSAVDGSRINNILNRVTGDTPSSILGAIESRNAFPNANVFLMNPNGIVFGSNARLDVAGSFTATTATGIGFAEQIFAASASKLDFPAGDPSQLVFSVSQPAPILNQGNLAVGNGSTIALIGGTVVSTGTLTAPGGNILLGAVPGDSVVELRSPNAVLGFTVAASQLPKDWNGTVTDLPQLASLLTSGIPQADQVVILPDGSLSLIDSKAAPIAGAVPVTNNTTVVSGTLDAKGTLSQSNGGSIGLFGQKVGAVAAEINVSGLGNGGIALIGGDYLGAGTVPNAQFTYVAPNATIRADAGALGDGGRVIVWSDVATTFAGLITARGGSVAGNGGFVETSGKVQLNALGGQVLAGATNGQPGTWLLDPTDITVTNFDNNLSFPTTPPFVFDPDDGTAFSQIGAFQIVDALNQGANVEILTASASFAPGNITFLNATINKTAGGVATLTLRADNNITLAGSTFTSTTGSLSLELFADNNVIIDSLTTIAPAVDTPSTVRINAGSEIRISSSFVTSTTSPVDVILRANDGITSTGGNFVTNGGLIDWQATGTSGSFISVTGGGIDTRAPSGNGGAISLVSSGNLGVTLANILSGGGNIFLGTNETLSITQAIQTVNVGSGTVTLSGNEINLFGTAGVVTGTGTVVIRPTSANQIVTIAAAPGFDGNGTGELDFDADDLSRLGPGFSRYIFGNEAGNDTVFIAGTISFDGALEFRAPGIDGRFRILTGSVVSSNSAITFTAGGELDIEDEVSFTSLGAAIAIVLNSDADGNGEGFITIDGSGIASNGGNITLGGGTDPLNNPAVGVLDIDLGIPIPLPGVSIFDSSIEAAGGNISIRGQGVISPDNRGVALEDTLIRTTGAGTITINGIGVAASLGTSAVGIELIDGVDIISGGSGAIALTGSVGVDAAASSGILIAPGNLVQGTNGTVTLTGTAANGTFNNNGIRILGDIETTGTGSITITGTNSSTGTLNSGVTIGTGGQISSASGTVTIRGTSSGDVGSQGLNLNEAIIQSLAGGNLVLEGRGTQQAIGTRIFDGTIRTTPIGEATIIGESANNVGVLLTTSSTGTLTVGTAGGVLTVRAFSANPAEVGLVLAPGGGSFFLTTTLGGGNGDVQILSDRTRLPAGLTNFFSTGTGTFQILPVSAAIPLAIGGSDTFVSNNFISSLGATGNYGEVVIGGSSITNPISFINNVTFAFTPNPVPVTISTGSTLTTDGFQVSSTGDLTFSGNAGVTLDLVNTPGALAVTSATGAVLARADLTVGSAVFAAGGTITVQDVATTSNLLLTSLGNVFTGALSGGAVEVDTFGQFTLNDRVTALSNIVLTGRGGGTVDNGARALTLSIDTGTNAVNLNGDIGADVLGITSSVINAGNNLTFAAISPGVTSTLSTPIVGTSSSRVTFADFAALTIAGAIGTAASPLGAVFLESSATTLAAPLFAENVTVENSLTLSADVTATAGLELLMAANVSVTGDRTLTAETIAIDPTASLEGTGNLVLQPVNPATTIGLGDGAPGTFNLNAAELAAIQDGFNSLTFGRADGSGLISLGTATFQDPVVFRSPGSTGLNLSGNLSGVDNVPFTFDVPVNLTTDSAVFTNTGNIVFNQPVNGGFNLTTQATAGSTIFNAPVGNTTPLTILTVAGNQTLVNSPVQAGRINLFSPISLNANVTASGELTLDAPVTLTGDRILTAADIIITSTASLVGTGNLVLQPVSPTATIGLGDGAPGSFNLDELELGAIQNGFNSLTFGRADGSGLISLGTATFQDPVVFRSPGSTGLNLSGNLSGVDNVAFTFDVPVNLTADSSISIAVGNIVFNQSVNGGFALTTSSFAGRAIFNAPVGNTAPLAELNLSGNQAEVNSPLRAGVIRFFSDGLLNADITADSQLVIDGALALTGDRNLTAETVAIGSTASLSGTGNLVLQPVNPATTIGLGDGAPGTFNLTALEITAIENGFNSLTFGRADGSGLVTVGTAEFRDPVFFRSAGLNLAGLLSGSDNAAFSFNVPVGITGDASVVTDTGNIIFNQSVNGGFSLLTNAIAGRTIFNAPVGNTQPLLNLLLAGNEVELNGGVRAGFVSFASRTVLNADVTADVRVGIDSVVTLTAIAQLQRRVLIFPLSVL